MRTYVITWNPRRWHWPDEEYVAEADATRKGQLFRSRWSCGNTRSISEGDRLFLLRQDTDRGIIGSGYAMGDGLSRQALGSHRQAQVGIVRRLHDRRTVTRQRPASDRSAARTGTRRPLEQHDVVGTRSHRCRGRARTAVGEASLEDWATDRRACPLPGGVLKSPVRRGRGPTSIGQPI